MRRVFTVVTIAILALSTPSADAQPTVMVDSTDLEATDSTATFTATNLGPDALRMTARTAQSGCTLELAPADLPAASETEPPSAATPTHVAVTLVGCDLTQGLSFVVDFSRELDVVASRSTFTVTEAEPRLADSTALFWYFAAALVPALIAICCACKCPCLSTRRSESPCDCRRPLYGVPDAWTFKDSWASNVTIAASGLTLFVASSDAMNALLGPEAEERLGTVVVGSAIAAALVAVSPIAALASKETCGEGKNVTQGGLLLGAVITLTGTCGQIVMLTIQGFYAIGGILGGAVVVAGGLSLLLVLVYAAGSLANLIGRPTPDEVAHARAVVSGFEIGQKLTASDLEALNKTSRADEPARASSL